MRRVAPFRPIGRPLPAASVGSKELKKNAVTSPKVKDGGPANTVVQLESDNPTDTNETIQCNGPDSAGTGRALGGGVAGDSDPVGTLDPTVELSAPVEADGSRAEADDQPTGWIGRIDWFNDASGTRTFTVYVICAAP